MVFVTPNFHDEELQLAERERSKLPMSKIEVHGTIVFAIVFLYRPAVFDTTSTDSDVHRGVACDGSNARNTAFVLRPEKSDQI